jgi:hypothetical protein
LLPRQLFHQVMPFPEWFGKPPLSDIARLCQKLISALGLALGGRFRRENVPSNQRFGNCLKPRLKAPSLGRS